MPNQLKKLTVPEHFYQPKNSTKWYVRLVPPQRIWHIVGGKEFRKSTRHADLQRAKPIGMTLIAEKLQEWDSMARALPDTTITPTILSSRLIETICSTRLYSWLRSDDDEREGDEGLSKEQIQDINEFCKLTDASMRSVTIQGKGSPRWSEVVDSTVDWCLTLGYGIEIEDPLFPNLVRKFAKVEQEAQKNIELRNRGEGIETPQARDGISLSAITDIFREHKAIKSGSSHVGTMLNAWGLFIEHCGDIAFDSVTQGHLFEFMEARMHAKRKPWSEARAKDFGLRTLREFFALARAKSFMTIANPADDLETFPALSKEDEESRKQPRYPFTPVQLNTFLTSDWYDPTNQSQFTGKMRTDLGVRYWAPLFGVCHGNRVSEGIQFVVSDFSFSGDLFVVSFQTELDKSSKNTKNVLEKKAFLGQTLSDEELKNLRHLKNRPTRRVVPVHPVLLRLGIVKFVAQRREEAGPNGLLFPSSEPNRGGKAPKLGRSYSQAFLKYVRDILGFGPGFGNHSFRHQLEDRIRNSQTPGNAWPAGLTQQYTGRQRTRAIDRDVILSEGSERDYGTGYLPSTMLPFMNKLDFSDVRFPLPYEHWLLTKAPASLNKKVKTRRRAT